MCGCSAKSDAKNMVGGPEIQKTFLFESQFSENPRKATKIEKVLPKGCQNGAREPFRSPWLPFRALWLPFGALRLPFGARWLPFGTFRLPFGALWLPFGTLWEPRGAKGEPKGAKRAAKSRLWHKTENGAKRSAFWRSKWMPFGSHFLTFRHLVFRRFFYVFFDGRSRFFCFFLNGPIVVLSKHSEWNRCLLENSLS